MMVVIQALGKFRGSSTFQNCGGRSSLLEVAAGPCRDYPGPPHPPGKCSIPNDDEVCPFFLCLSPELSIDELRCRFLGVALGDGEVAAACGSSLAGGEGLMAGESNGSGGGDRSLFRWLQNGH